MMSAALVYMQGTMNSHNVTRWDSIGAQSVLWTARSITSGRFMLRTSYRPAAITGSTILVVCAAWMILKEPWRGRWWPTLGAAILGVGFGLVNVVFVIPSKAQWSASSAALRQARISLCAT